MRTKIKILGDTLVMEGEGRNTLVYSLTPMDSFSIKSKPDKIYRTEGGDVINHRGLEPNTSMYKFSLTSYDGRNATVYIYPDAVKPLKEGLIKYLNQRSKK